MKIDIQNLLRELESFGKSNDKLALDRQEKMLNITPDTGVFLSILVQSNRAKRILEIGTSNGYSSIWLANAVDKIDGQVTTIEIQDHKIGKAKSNFERSGLAHRIRLIQGDAGSLIKTERSNSYDLIFLDSDREQYHEWWNDLVRILTPGGMLVVDNAISHEHEMLELSQVVKKNNFEHILVPIGNGELVILKPL
jgi:predicted O-methyltransferase YrrM